MFWENIMTVQEASDTAIQLTRIRNKSKIRCHTTLKLKSINNQSKRQTLTAVLHTQTSAQSQRISIISVLLWIILIEIAILSTGFLLKFCQSCLLKKKVTPWKTTMYIDPRTSNTLFSHHYEPAFTTNWVHGYTNTQCFLTQFQKSSQDFTKSLQQQYPKKHTPKSNLQLKSNQFRHCKVLKESNIESSPISQDFSNNIPKLPLLSLQDT